jgi:hypothetical protein
MVDDLYDSWIEERRSTVPPDEMVDRVMQSVLELQSRDRQAIAVRLAGWIERSRLARSVACATAMLIGSMPFVTFFVYLMVV